MWCQELEAACDGLNPPPPVLPQEKLAPLPAPQAVDGPGRAAGAAAAAPAELRPSGTPPAGPLLWARRSLCRAAALAFQQAALRPLDSLFLGQLVCFGLPFLYAQYWLLWQMARES